MYKMDREILQWAYEAERKFDNWHESEEVLIKAKMFGETSEDLFLFDGSQDWNEFVQESIAKVLDFAFDFESAELWHNGETVEARERLTDRVLIGSVKVKRGRNYTDIIVKF